MEMSSVSSKQFSANIINNHLNRIFSNDIKKWILLFPLDSSLNSELILWYFDSRKEKPYERCGLFSVCINAFESLTGRQKLFPLNHFHIYCGSL